MDGPPVRREEAGASQMENPAPQAEGNDPGAGEAQEPNLTQEMGPWMNSSKPPHPGN